MRAVPGSSEPIIGAWARADVAQVARRLRGPDPSTRRIIAVDGRSGAGKSTLALQLAAALPDAAVVATDDVAWHLSMFDWADELASGVLAPFLRGDGVRYVPPGWRPHGRGGEIVVPATARTLFVEGVGSSRRELRRYLAKTVWVQCDAKTAGSLGIERDLARGDHASRGAAIAFWEEWRAAEEPFLERDAPWLRADVILAGVPLAQEGLYQEA